MQTVPCITRSVRKGESCSWACSGRRGLMLNSLCFFLRRSGFASSWSSLQTCSESFLIPDSLPPAYNYIKVILQLQPNVSRSDETILPPTTNLFFHCRKKINILPRQKKWFGLMQKHPLKKKNQWIFPDFTENKKCNLDNYNPGYSIHLGLHIYIFLYLAKSLMISFDFCNKWELPSHWGWNTVDTPPLWIQQRFSALCQVLHFYALATKTFLHNIIHWVLPFCGFCFPALG